MCAKAAVLHAHLNGNCAADEGTVAEDTRAEVTEGKGKAMQKTDGEKKSAPVLLDGVGAQLNERWSRG